MRPIVKRLARIEEWLCPAANTAYLRRLGVWLDAARSRMAKCGYNFADVASKREDTRMTLIDRLQRGRQRALS